MLYTRPGVEVLSTHILEYIFEVLVCILIQLMGHVLELILNVLYSDFTSTLRVHPSTFSIYAVKVNLFVVNKMKLS